MITYRRQTVPVFSLPVNWETEVLVAEDYGGIVVEALATNEQRLGTRPRELHAIQFRTLSMGPKEQGYTRKLLETPLEMPFAVPLWPSQVKLAAANAIGNAFVTCDDTYGGMFDLVPHAMIWSAYDRFETFHTFQVGPNAVQFAEATSLQFAAGDMLVPIALGWLKRPEPGHVTDVNGEFEVDFTEAFLQEASYLATAITGTDQYQTKAFTLVGTGGQQP